MSSGCPSPSSGFPSFKRLFDLAIAIPSVFVLSPVLVLIGFMVRKRIGTSVLFRQVRPGLHGKPFTIYKFSTMIDERDENGSLLPDGVQLTSLGRFLRKMSLDELPECCRVEEKMRIQCVECVSLMSEEF